MIMRLFSPSRVRNIFICIVVGVLGFVQNDDGIGQRTAAHERQRRDLDFAGLQRAFDDLRNSIRSYSAS